ncbi:uncharacterized protein LOC120233902 isoform X2 [Hyaena hyaena]|uniref:uncharacterized protein LOC120233902 isoform X2 n=1 Tax=Hyaena hyaena TaxID=95912 RepID=UPI0019223BE8|nr:uncharacterized protein LOC120233902 isoform X2 [Hyaena hyaena]
MGQGSAAVRLCAKCRKRSFGHQEGRGPRRRPRRGGGGRVDVRTQAGAGRGTWHRSGPTNPSPGGIGPGPSQPMAERGTLLSASSQSARRHAATHPSRSSNQLPGGCHVSGGPGAAEASLRRLPSGRSLCALLSAGPPCWWGSPHGGAPRSAAPCSLRRRSARAGRPSRPRSPAACTQSPERRGRGPTWRRRTGGRRRTEGPAAFGILLNFARARAEKANNI